MAESPYYIDRRLSDVIAAITVLASHRNSEGYISMWAGQLSKPGDAEENNVYDRWKAVFEEHPEFFLVYTLSGETKPKAALRLRYANKAIDPTTGQPHPELTKLTSGQRAKLTSLPLDPGIANALVSIAINLHSAELARRAESRFWYPFVGPVLGLIGGIAVAYCTSLLNQSHSSDKPLEVQAHIVGTIETSSASTGGK